MLYSAEGLGQHREGLCYATPCAVLGRQCHPPCLHHDRHLKMSSLLRSTSSQAHLQVVVLEHGQHLVCCPTQHILRLVSKLALDGAQQGLIRCSRLTGAGAVASTCVEVQHADISSLQAQDGGQAFRLLRDGCCNGAESWRSLLTNFELPGPVMKSKQPAASRLCLHTRGTLWCQRGAYLKEGAQQLAEPTDWRRCTET